MREGAALMVQNRNQHNIDYLVRKLNGCSRKHDGCEGCHDEEPCLAYYDLRCDSEEATCPECGETVIIKKYCMKCRALLKVPGRNGSSKGSENIKH